MLKIYVDNWDLLEIVIAIASVKLAIEGFLQLLCCSCPFGNVYKFLVNFLVRLSCWFSTCCHGYCIVITPLISLYFTFR